MINEPCVITVESVSKRFRLRAPGGQTLKSAALDMLRAHRKREDLWALRDISFRVRAGETLGIIGANGAGKSTLLALLAGTMQPTTGRIQVRGTISSLLELGAGFHPDLTGRENVFLAGAIMGIPQRRMRERYAAIVDFAGLEGFMDQPVKHYSSGMYIRLGFAVAVEVDPDVLLIDEVLAVGDAAFQRKCLQRMGEFRRRGKTMLIISHDLAAIQAVSHRILFLDHGRIMGDGEPSEIIGQYEAFWRRQNSQDLRREWGTKDVVITRVEFMDQSGRPCERFDWGEAVTIRIHYEARRPVENPVFGFAVCDEQGRLVHGNNTQNEGVRLARIEGPGVVVLRLGSLDLARGGYLFSFSVHSWDHRVNYHRLDNHFPIAVDCDKPFEGCCYIPCEWAVPGLHPGGQEKGAGPCT